ncbi:MAG: hypothetical protein AUI14_17945 [Actinobacteria bacterium 13_2_20CM_2_71_6]|nr:MAG: hypothetical protein AUI14_17945 [Actinobacteria bacterium 13_2_20CM_2_71_6]
MLALVAVSIGVVVAGLVGRAQVDSLRQHGATADAVVVDNYRTGSRTGGPRAHVRYVDAVGTQQICDAAPGDFRDGQLPPAGTRLTIRYDTTNPALCRDAGIAVGTAEWLVPLVLGVLGIIAGAALLLWRRRR